MVDPHCPIGNCSTHDLFNELHRRLDAEAEEVDQDTSREYLEAANTIDELHHFYTDLVDPKPTRDEGTHLDCDGTPYEDDHDEGRGHGS